MPRGPNGERRPRNTIENAIRVARIATGEIEEDLPSATRRGGLIGGPARARSLSPERRSEIARMGAEARRDKGE
jgi:hypothetical protein